MSVYEQLEREWQELLASVPEEQGADAAAARAAAAKTPLRPAAVFAELEDVRLGFAELVASGLLEKHAERLITRKWTLRDLLAHLASWAAEFRKETEIAARGGDFDYTILHVPSPRGPNEWNQERVEERRSLSLAEILAEYERETLRLQELVLLLPEETLAVDREFPLSPTGDPAALLRSSIGDIASMKCFHDRYHFARIRPWLEAQEAQGSR